MKDDEINNDTLLAMLIDYPCFNSNPPNITGSDWVFLQRGFQGGFA